MMNKDKRARQGQRSLYIRTLVGFLVFYLLAMIAMTAVMHRNVRVNNLNRLYESVQETENIAQAMDAIDDNGWSEPKKTMAGLLRNGQCYTGLYPFASKMYLCDENYDVLAESGTMLISMQQEVRTRNLSQTVVLSWPRGDKLDKLSDAELLQIWQLLEKRLSFDRSKPDGFMETQNAIRAWGHWEGREFVVTKLSVVEETWQVEVAGNSYTLIGSQPIAEYTLGECLPEDEELLQCDISFECYCPLGQHEPVYNSHVQKAFRDSEQVFTWVQGELREESDGMTACRRGRGFWAYDIYALKSCNVELEGQQVGYIIATARTYPIWQAMRTLWPLYLAGLITAMLLAGIMAWQLTKLQRRQKQLEDSRQALLVAVAHELKNPLSVIKNYSEGLLEDIAQDKRDDYLRVIIDETEQLDHMVVELLSLTRLTTAGETLRKQAVDLNVLLEKLSDRCQHALKEQDLRLTMDIAPQTTVLADERLLEQAIANLLSNAINYTPVGGEITLTADKDQITIANQGPQIPDEQWPHLFEPFYKAEGDRHRMGQGTGLGLAIVQAIASLHDMTIDGRNLDDGVAFTLHFSKATVSH